MDRRQENPLNLEVSDIAFINNGNVTLSHVKFSLENKSLSYNIDQSISSVALVENKAESLVKYISKHKLNFNIEDISDFELIILVNSKEYESIVENGKVNWNKLNGRNISKLKLLEWKYMIAQNSKNMKIKIIEIDSNFNKWKSIVDPHNTFNWPKKNRIS